MKKANLKGIVLTPADVTQLSNCSAIVFSAHIYNKKMSFFGLWPGRSFCFWSFVGRHFVMKYKINIVANRLYDCFAT